MLPIPRSASRFTAKEGLAPKCGQPSGDTVDQLRERVCWFGKLNMNNVGRLRCDDGLLIFEDFGDQMRVTGDFSAAAQMYSEALTSIGTIAETAHLYAYHACALERARFRLRGKLLQCKESQFFANSGTPPRAEMMPDIDAYMGVAMQLGEVAEARKWMRRAVEYHLRDQAYAELTQFLLSELPRQVDKDLCIFLGAVGEFTSFTSLADNVDWLRTHTADGTIFADSMYADAIAALIGIQTGGPQGNKQAIAFTLLLCQMCNGETGLSSELMVRFSRAFHAIGHDVLS